MNEEQQSFIVKVTRYGLPVVVGIFYVTASLGFSFTADSTFQVLSLAKSTGSPGMFPTPLWQFLLMTGRAFGVDQLLASKVLSLVFSCSAILAGYLVGNEILGDRLIAFCVSLVFGMEGWMLQLAPSGSAITLAILLALSGLFFMLRNEYVVAPFILGLCTLVIWQAVFLLVPLYVDIWMNSVDKRRAVKVVLSASLVYCSSLLPLVLYSWYSGEWGLPSMLPVSELPGFSVGAVVILVVLCVSGVGGMWLVMRTPDSRSDAFRTGSGAVAFILVLIVLAPAFHSQIALAALPLVIIYSYVGLAELLRWIGKSRILYSLSFVLTGLLVVHMQMEYQHRNRESMAAAVAQNAELRILSEWIRENSTDTSSVCAEHPGIVGYYSDRQVRPSRNYGEPDCDMIVTSREVVAGYDVAFKPPTLPDDVRSYAVWRRR